MDTQTRHWYLQQMGIPQWLPRAEVQSLALQADEAVANNAGESPAAEAASNSSTESGLSPAQQIAQSLRLQQGGQATAAVAPAAAQSKAAVWLVMPDVDPAQRAEAEQLLDKILKAAELPKQGCELIWALPETLPPAAVKHVWCFGIQPPGGLSANCMALPSLAVMLSNAEAKKQAWAALKAAMPFTL